MTDPLAALTALICEHSGLTGVRAERLARRIAAEWLPAQGVVDLCHNGHPFEPGIDQDDPDRRYPSPDWCNVCGEARRTRPVVDREALAEALMTDDMREHGWGHEREIASGVITDAADVRRQTAERIADEIKTAGLTKAAEADIDNANRAWWYGYGYGSEDAIRIAREVGGDRG